MEVQIFRHPQERRHAQGPAIFSERGWKTHFVDLAERPLSAGELRRFTERFGVEGLVDREAKRFRDLGLAAAPPGADRWSERLLAEPLLLRQPLGPVAEPSHRGSGRGRVEGMVAPVSRGGIGPVGLPNAERRGRSGGRAAGASSDAAARTDDRPRFGTHQGASARYLV